MNKDILFLLAPAVPVLTMGVGCSTKISSIQTAPVATTTYVSCVTEGQRPNDGAKCCVDLEVVATDNAYEVCGKPETGYKPKACVTEGETPFVDTPKCCTNLEPILEGDKYVCTKTFKVVSPPAPTITYYLLQGSN